jgi:LysR family hydrogen peroxide-inducible transcriptional activator
MEVHQLRYFVAVAELGSMSRASLRCGVAQPSISQQIQKLERELACPLFERIGRRIQLTDAGRSLLPRARAILEQLQEIPQGLEEDAKSGHGRLVVGAIPTVAPFLLPAAIRALTETFPAVDLHVREDLTERLLDALEAGEIDLAVTSTPITREGLGVLVIGRDPFTVAVAANHPLAGRDSISLAELVSPPTILLDELHCLGRQVGEVCRAMRTNCRVVCQASQLDSLLRMVGLGLGVALVPEMATHDAPKDEVRFVPIEEPFASREIAVVQRGDRPVSHLAQEFVRRLAAAFEPTAAPAAATRKSRPRKAP